jgi:2,4-dienoyl-CoA reductase-like NADH-dependent reductase (Old Yellow Enzyme family)
MMVMAKSYPRMVRFKTADSFLEYLRSLEIEIPFDKEVTRAPEGPLAQPYRLSDSRRIGNRFCIHPMEGWDGTQDGKPTDLTFRRWRNFGLSGAKLIWGCEATAVRPDGRANPNQLMIIDQTMNEIERLRLALVDEHRVRFGTTEDLMVGLQLTHSGRFCRPNDKEKLEPKILYHHPPIEAIYQTPPDWPVMTDGEIDDLIGDYVLAARRAKEIGFEFVDIKHCHGYLGHEFLSAYSRPGRYGGSFENRTRFLREIVAGIRKDCPGLRIGVRVSAFDFPPFARSEDGTGRMVEYRDESGRYPFAFGGDPVHPGRLNVEETAEFITLLEKLGIRLVNISAGSPYYNPHTTRPATFPPSDGYLPPEDPLIGVARHIHLCAELKKRVPGPALVGSAYTYLQEWLPNVAQAAVREGMVDFVGLGRMVLAYPEMPADVLAGRPLARTRICRTFSDCTTAPRSGLVSGCYPLDDFYKQRPEYEQLKRIKTPGKEKHP